MESIRLGEIFANRLLKHPELLELAAFVIAPEPSAGESGELYDRNLKDRRDSMFTQTKSDGVHCVRFEEFEIFGKRSDNG